VLFHVVESTRNQLTVTAEAAGSSPVVPAIFFNTTAFAISSGVPNQPSGVSFSIIFLRSSQVSVEANRSPRPGVSIEPGLIAFTRIWRSLRSVVHVRANERIAAVVAL
jgi:hypothetical protein